MNIIKKFVAVSFLTINILSFAGSLSSEQMHMMMSYAESVKRDSRPRVIQLSKWLYYLMEKNNKDCQAMWMVINSNLTSEDKLSRLLSIEIAQRERRFKRRVIGVSAITGGVLFCAGFLYYVALMNQKSLCGGKVVNVC